MAQTETAEETRRRLQEARAAGEDTTAHVPWILDEAVRAECGVFNPLSPIYLILAYMVPKEHAAALMCLGVRTSRAEAERLCERILEDEGEVRQFFIMQAGQWVQFPPRVHPQDFHGRHPDVVEILRAGLEQEQAALREMQEAQARASVQNK